MKSLPDPFESRRREMRRALLGWYAEHKRDLPWRRESDPYRIWLSEVLLQQTRVDTVRERYTEWLRRYPTLEAVADADLDEVLKSWEGLGYYARARNFHRAAREVRASYGGRVPGERDAFLTLPGVGRYTAGAVLSIAFGRPEPVVDGNVRRVFSRLMSDASPTPALLWRCAAALVEEDGGERPGDLNQAVMELGATVCLPRGPDCGRCPLAGMCRAHALGRQEECPAPPRKRTLPVRRIATAGIHANGRWLLRQRAHDGLLGGMWEFPGYTIADGGSRSAREIVALGVSEDLGAEIGEWTDLGMVPHLFSHFRAEYHALSGEIERPAGLTLPDRYRWVSRSEMAALALPTAQRRIATLLQGEAASE